MRMKFSPVKKSFVDYHDDARLVMFKNENLLLFNSWLIFCFGLSQCYQSENSSMSSTEDSPWRWALHGWQISQCTRNGTHEKNHFMWLELLNSLCQPGSFHFLKISSFYVCVQERKFNIFAPLKDLSIFIVNVCFWIKIWLFQPP